MAEGPKVAAALHLKFADADALAEALQRYAGAHGAGGLCIQVTKYYELGDTVRLHLDFGEEPLDIHACVAWRRPGFIGVRLQPAGAPENRAFLVLKNLLGEKRHVQSAPPVDETAPTKPFAD